MTDHKSFTNVEKWIKTTDDFIPEDCIVFLVGAKIDLGKKRAVKSEEIQVPDSHWKVVLTT